ncbi:MAG: hypothetical protein L7V86_16295 [Verrucomicrobiales bacterium]|jgi:hypothetical protein|nr:hypothetical protein [Verrucomicrobiales bacterium]MDF1790206.1 hypothetical protein [Verrucomicrobiales bacterium]
MNRLVTLLVLSLPTLCLASWPPAAGPNYQYLAEGKALTKFSVARGEGVP